MNGCVRFRSIGVVWFDLKTYQKMGEEKSEVHVDRHGFLLEDESCNGSW